MECFRTRSSFLNYRISPLTRKYKPPRLSPFDGLKIRRYPNRRSEMGKKKKSGKKFPFLFFFKTFSAFDRTGHLGCCVRLFLLHRPPTTVQFSSNPQGSSLSRRRAHWPQVHPERVYKVSIRESESERKRKRKRGGRRKDPKEKNGSCPPALFK